jgi:hypothetical protein
VLVPAKGLVDDQAGRVDYSIKAVELLHIIVARHEVILTEGPIGQI